MISEGCYICPKCDGEITVLLIATFPPEHRFKCNHCEQIYDDESELKRVVIIDSGERAEIEGD